MGKFRCVCAEVISTSGEIPRRTVVLYRCPKSDHIWAFWDGFDPLAAPSEIDELATTLVRQAPG